ncbi:MAG: hypothetical protein A3A08_01605 [Candidatus Nealsonbacteria bacterium RIFCSPLOWO2_01_FULL_41_9]|uniref:Uncharacterized protein n=1 Tax=Candidatus Nealsonbacteria bacterium RIFCSPLOWO2_01_FULL_41_9 TaxID=1801671 RepID=A0A1G2ECK7_9BACT|nr:MAG: hypothetical protein A3A08_01605 [Candidatus Nealsonbacteria bacterium RIFCSPLOWO2_01_FULL_41_9]
MPNKYTKEQFWKLYEKLPQELKDALWAEETGNNIEDICQRYEIEENVGDIVDLVGQVLVGVLAPKDFQETLEKELKLEKNTAKKAAQEINRFIFYPVRTELEKLYQTKTTPVAGAVTPSPIKEEPFDAGHSAELSRSPQGKEEKPTEPGKADSYREPIE